MAIDQAIIFLRDLLGDGLLPANDVRTQADDAGFSWATIRRAKERAGVVVLRQSVGGAGAGQWLWSLPVSQDTQGQDAPSQGEQAQAAQAAPTQAAQPQGAAVQLPSRQHAIRVRRPGVAPEGPNEISFEQWQELGCETGTNCPRIKEFLRLREAANAPRECSPYLLRP